MKGKLGVQLYSVRDQISVDFESTIRSIAAMGFAGVETAGIPSTYGFEKAAKLFKQLGLQVCSSHTGAPVDADEERIISEMKMLGCNNIITGKGPDDFNTMDKIKATCDFFNRANENAKKHGMKLGIHNHWWEFIPVDGTPVYKSMLKFLDPSVFFEVDTYWVKVAGMDPAAVVAELGPRAPFLHIKDGPCVKDQPMTAAGKGKMDFPAIVAKASADWLVVELDACATDMMTAVRESADYLLKNGLATGK